MLQSESHWRYQFKLTSTFKLKSHLSHYPINHTWAWLADFKALSVLNTLLNAFVPCYVGARLLQSSGHDLYLFTFPASSVLSVCSMEHSSQELLWKRASCSAMFGKHCIPFPLLEKHNVYSYIKVLRNPAAKKDKKINVWFLCVCDSTYYHPVEETLERPLSQWMSVVWGTAQHPQYLENSLPDLSGTLGGKQSPLPTGGTNTTRFLCAQLPCSSSVGIH